LIEKVPIMAIKKIPLPTLFLCLFIILNLVIGAFIVGDFGRSTDEAHEGRSAAVALSMYTLDFEGDPIEAYDGLGHDQYYGTASTGLVSFVEHYLFPNQDHRQKVVAHYCYFLFFQAALISLYPLLKRYFNRWISLLITVLFGTQPLLFGHAFINPKDIPMLALFLGAIVLGFRMVDRWAEGQTDQEAHVIPRNSDDQPNLLRRRRLVLVLLVVWALIFGSIEWIRDLALSAVEIGYTSTETTLLGKVFASLTTSGSLEGYRMLTDRLFINLSRWVSFLTFPVLFGVFHWVKKKRIFGSGIDLHTLAAGAVWGFAISTKVIAVGAGGLVGIYALYKLKREAIQPLVIYSAAAGLVCFITWPFLWLYGFRGLVESLLIFSKFPWSGQVLFNGQYYPPTGLPVSYFPKLMAIQFTLPLVVLAVCGFFIGIYQAVKHTGQRGELAILYLWLFVPPLMTIATHATVYSNFRHFLFIIPPIAVFAGFSIQQISNRLKHIPMLIALSLLAVIPGMVSIAQIHPYEYFYYNSFVGGVQGADQRFELDYWGLAYKDAMAFVNENAPAGSHLLIWKDNLSGAIYADREFTIKAHTSVPEDEIESFDFMVIPANRLTESGFGVYPILHSVQVNQVDLMYVLQLPGTGE
jgi:hypothetical protein